ncbi:hypothetical protein Pyn_04317 [Prunus yedoensis var. nudiflora]|uniref:Uncharacterized protein n=1 Tax=Prunus yedoensis var. nudiflora TaxID=2094558 RepID=A0A314UAS5_PRUYE|nr:hypothetical protein Pyn_04317 [Prunus yedoensis var. nudiflora]
MPKDDKHTVNRVPQVYLIQLAYFSANLEPGRWLVFRFDTKLSLSKCEPQTTLQ